MSAVVVSSLDLELAWLREHKQDAATWVERAVALAESELWRDRYLSWSDCVKAEGLVIELTPSQRPTVLTTMFEQGMSQVQIATVTGIPRTTVQRAIKGSAQSGHPPRSAIADQSKSPDRRKQAQRRKAEQETRKTQARVTRERINAESQRSLAATVRNAPEGALNLPALRRMRSARSMLRNLAEIPPERFVSQIPIEACREVSSDVVDWWLEVSRLAAARLEIEGLHLPSLVEVSMRKSGDSSDE